MGLLGACHKLLLYTNCRMSDADLFGDEIESDGPYSPRSEEEDSEEEDQDEMEEVGKGKQRLGAPATSFYRKRKAESQQHCKGQQKQQQKDPVEGKQRKHFKTSGIRSAWTAPTLMTRFDVLVQNYQVVLDPHIFEPHRSCFDVEEYLNPLEWASIE